MKNKLYLIIILIMALNITLHSQDTEPSPLKFNYIINGNNIINQPFSSEYFQQKKFSLGWHWGDQAKITRSLLMNQTDVNTDSKHYKVPDSTLLFIRAILKIGAIDYNLWTHCNFDNHPVFGKSLCYDPTLYIDPNDKYKLNIREGDPQNPIFGFKYINPSISIKPNDRELRYYL